jgi:hypothetical protein
MTFLERSDYAEEFVGVSGIGNHKYDVILHYHSEVAMKGIESIDI